MRSRSGHDPDRSGLVTTTGLQSYNYRVTESQPHGYRFKTKANGFIAIGLRFTATGLKCYNPRVTELQPHSYRDTNRG